MVSNKSCLNEKINTLLNSNCEIDENIIDIIKKKRGRKSNKELLLLKKYNDNKKDVSNNKVPKKRGRKPKGGKLIKPLDVFSSSNENKQFNIILHLRCSSNEITNETFLSKFEYNPNVESIQPFDESQNNKFQNTKIFNIEVDNNNIHNHNDNIIFNDEQEETKSHDTSIKAIWMKLKELQSKFNNKSICDKKSSCFWCTCDFDCPPIHIPKCIIDGKVEVYGCFCMPECAAGYLFNENIDTSTKWERYSLLNNLYSDIYNYENNIKPSPDPRYLLNKFFGNLTIAEYRTLLRKGKRMLIINKPLTHILPELVEDSIEENNNSKQYKLSRKKPAYNKLKTNNKSWAF